MSWLVVGIIFGILIGLNIREDKTARTLEELDADMRKDLERYKNLSQSLLQDVQYWRERYNTLHKVKEK